MVTEPLDDLSKVAASTRAISANPPAGVSRRVEDRATAQEVST